MKNILFGLLIAVFLLTRLLVSPSEVMLGQDNLKYLITADNFPKHTLYNGQIYLVHPPLFPYFIHILDLAVNDTYKSALMLVFISSALLLFILYKFFMLTTNDWRISFFVITFYTLSVSFIELSTKVLRESFVVMLVFLCLYFYIKGIKEKSFKAAIGAGTAGMLLAATSDLVIFIFPSILLAYFAFRKSKLHYKFLIVPLIMVFAVYVSWNAIRYYEYSANEYYPNGVEGSIISTANARPWNLITPFFFEDANEPYVKTDITTIPKKVLFNMGYMFNIEPFRIPPGLNLTTMQFLLKPIHLAFMALVYLPLAIIALIGAKKAIIKAITERKHDFYFTCLFIIFLIPIFQKIVSPRHLIVSSIFLFYFIAYGMTARQKQWTYFLMAVLIFMIPFWITTHQHITFFQEQVIEPQNTINFIIKNIPKSENLMIQPGYGLRIMQGTGNNIVGMPEKPDNFMEVIELYNTYYFIFGKIYTDYHGQYSIETINYIRGNQNFELIATLNEDYSRFYPENDPKRKDAIKIYKVKK